MKNSQAQIIVAVILFALPLTSRAALIPTLGGQLLYDTDLNITWLANANLAASIYPESPVHSAGTMRYDLAQSWITNLNAIDYLGYHDWRLPTTLQPDVTCQYLSSYGNNCSGSEMGHLFYKELGGVAGQSIQTTHNANYNLFKNLQPFVYWSSTGYRVEPYYGFEHAWYFGFGDGYQSTIRMPNELYALAVRSGPVAVVPVPGTGLLLGSGLLGLTCFKRRRLQPR